MSDLISRQNAIEVARKYLLDNYITDADWHADGIAHEIESLPSADRPTGRWEVVDATEPRRYGCSKCKRLSWDMSNFCPNCGADMRGEEE